MSGVQLGGRESDLIIPECGLAIMSALHSGKYDQFIKYRLGIEWTRACSELITSANTP